MTKYNLREVRNEIQVALSERVKLLNREQRDSYIEGLTDSDIYSFDLVKKADIALKEFDFQKKIAKPFEIEKAYFQREIEKAYDDRRAFIESQKESDYDYAIREMKLSELSNCLHLRIIEEQEKELSEGVSKSNKDWRYIPEKKRKQRFMLDTPERLYDMLTLVKEYNLNKNDIKRVRIASNLARQLNLPTKDIRKLSKLESICSDDSELGGINVPKLSPYYKRQIVPVKYSGDEKQVNLCCEGNNSDYSRVSSQVSTKPLLTKYCPLFGVGAIGQRSIRKLELGKRI